MPIVVEFLIAGDVGHRNDGAGFPEVGNDAGDY